MDGKNSTSSRKIKSFVFIGLSISSTLVFIGKLFKRIGVTNKVDEIWYSAVLLPIIDEKYNKETHGLMIPFGVNTERILYHNNNK